jgi:peptide deformylase
VTRLAVLEYPDVRLRRIATPVVHFDSLLHRLVDDLFETLADTGAIGLAATQVDVHQRVLVTHVREPGVEPAAYVNPEIIAREWPAMAEESCLSLPGVVGLVPRSGKIRVRARDRQGVAFERDLTGLEAVCLQHEMEHLQGVLFSDHLSWLRRWRIQRQLGKTNKPQASAG